MKNQIRLDEVGIFGEKIQFLIPHEWVEVDDGADDVYLYQAPHTDSGWLRVSLITLNTNEPEERLLRLFADSGDLYISEKRGNYVQRSEKHSHENGSDIHIYYWKVANVVLPDRVLEAVFSYTILAERREESETQELVELVGNLVAETIFSTGPENSTLVQ
jgi:hypothetical protein